ncbi:PAQR family membrane homeostasis protein TrhA [Isachenkonia alkalipeptolytica]|uniref:Hemolysin III family protein n=1 Tax=Isachenkonia alkalipeptolytica TaxID=2565777 RepID=A0AA43XIF3_9CLOT|nr:hemolysin III family protein [Isachenkonia alkalipeptolytica]NBG87398.1 hemolysin III family protein [Isachenkonia alkalipeptolytica]
MGKVFREPVSGFTHMAGAVLSLIGMIFLLVHSIRQGEPMHILAFTIFGLSLILLYTASTLYHLLPLSEKGIRTLKKIDHMMIFILIAGTYTPVCLLALEGWWRTGMLLGIWTFALGGVFLKAFWINAPRWFSTGIYLIMGWLVVVAIIPIYQALSFGGFFYLLLGGIFYSVGAIIYGLKRPNITTKHFGFHEIFHIFVMLGSLFHFFLMYFYVLPMEA